MKKKSLILALILALTISFCFGCQKNTKDAVIKDGKTCNIQIVKAGYGVDWIYELKTKFENVYKEEGYKLNILTPSYDMKGETVRSLLAQGYNETGVDLYITGDLLPEYVGVKSDYGVLCADLRETVYNKKPIKYDGTEEEKTIAEKADPNLEKYLVDSTNTMYGFNWVSSSAGMVVNRKKLAQYGITEYPKTTKEMFDTFEKIYLGSNGIANSEESMTFPFVFSGYYSEAIEVWMAQYDYDEYLQFMSMENNGSPMESDGYEVFKLKAVEESIAESFHLYDVNIASYGSTTQNLDQAQAAIIKNKGSNGVFMGNGDWFLNEVKLNYKSYLNDIDFIGYPVISSLGTKLMGQGTAYNLAEDKCEAILSDIVSLVDENKEINEIISSITALHGVTLSEETVQEIAHARGLNYSRGVEHIAYIDKNAGCKDIAELVLRMMASEDFADTFARLANGTTPYTRTENTYSSYDYVKNASKIAINKYATVINKHGLLTGFRRDINLSVLFTTTNDLATTIATSSTSPTIYENGAKNGNSVSVYKDAAKAFVEGEYQNVKKNWSYWLSNRR